MILLVLAAAASPLPADVRAFQRRHELCEHLTGEEAYDAARGRELDASWKKNCRGIDAARMRLIVKYKKRPAARRTVLAMGKLES